MSSVVTSASDTTEAARQTLELLQIWSQLDADGRGELLSMIRHKSSES